MRTKSRAPVLAGKPVVPDYVAINAALEKHLDLSWTFQNQQAIKRDVGAVNYLKIGEIISFTSSQDAWLTDYSVSSAADKVSGKLGQRYPELSPLAVFKITNQATYGWR